MWELKLNFRKHPEGKEMRWHGRINRYRELVGQFQSNNNLLSVECEGGSGRIEEPCRIAKTRKITDQLQFL